MSYINHHTIDSGHNLRSPNTEVGRDTIAMLTPWLSRCIQSGVIEPLPVSDLASYGAKASIIGGGLVMTVYADMTAPLVTFGVAMRSRQPEEVWAAIAEGAPGNPPPTPWVSVKLHKAAVAPMSPGLAWLGDFERCIAWTWVNLK